MTLLYLSHRWQDGRDDDDDDTKDVSFSPRSGLCKMMMAERTDRAFACNSSRVHTHVWSGTSVNGSFFFALLFNQHQAV
jgi:hypothetical protein